MTTLDWNGRDLAPSEQLFTPEGIYVAYSMLCSGDVDPLALAGAYFVLRHNHPLLSSAIGLGADGELVFRPVPGPHPSIRVAREDPFARLTATDDILGQDRLLAQLDLIMSPGHARVTLLLHHSVADGQRALRLLSELWNLYARQLAGEPTPITPQAVPDPLESELAARGVTRAATSGIERLLPTLPPGLLTAPHATPSPVAARPLTLGPRIRLSESDTAALRRLGRTHDLTVNALVSAVLLSAVARERSDGGAARIPLRYAVDLRARLEPPIRAANWTNLFTFGFHLAELAPADDLLPVARELAEVLATDLRDGTLQQASLHLTLDNPLGTALFMSSVMITNWGVIEPFPAPEGLSFTDFRGAFWRTVPAPVLPELTPPQFIVSTFDNRLAIDIGGPNAFHTQESDQRLADYTTEVFDRLLHRSLVTTAAEAPKYPAE
ncbi:phthiocerol/phthiodiolone dimycocerosyl transferase family protein [Nocardia concava]|uniref:phthiocerol/phthiodiolone dimycocerosyl transferase family protein n=1 Tax=Nocardia concava TaxID=257281 RepID=UPI00031C679E|nr:hypothetical protein [Nocardia concava]